MKLDVVLFYYESDELHLCCNGCDAVWITVVSVKLMNTVVGQSSVERPLSGIQYFTLDTL